jgi:phage repressor protein C with HTH and peptisase S24 domain
MSTIGQAIRQERLRARVTLEDLSQAIGLSKSQISLIESGQRTIREEKVREIESFLRIRDERLVHALRWENTPPPVRAEFAALARRDAEARHLAERLKAAVSKAKRGRNVLDELLRSGELRRWVTELSTNLEESLPLGRQVPVINKVAAGYPREFTDLDYPARHADDYIACPDVGDPDAFAARVVGDSMEPDYREGEIVVFSPSMPTPSGSDCFVRLERDNETTFKRVYFEDGGRSIRLQPLNNRYPPQVVRRQDIGGLYAAAYVMRKVGAS